MEHNLKGNCWAEEVSRDDDGELLDVCLEHDEPRGECSVCPPCEACAVEDDS